MTGKEMCETIVREHNWCVVEGFPSFMGWPPFESRLLTPEQVWSYSSTGELFMIWEWYDAALWVAAAREVADAG